MYSIVDKHTGHNWNHVVDVAQDEILFPIQWVKNNSIEIDKYVNSGCWQYHIVSERFDKYQITYNKKYEMLLYRNKTNSEVSVVWTGP